MDNIFKNRFENFEHEPPKQMLEQVLDQIDSMEKASGNSSSINKAWMYGVSAVVLVALVSSMFLFNSPEDQPETLASQDISAPAMIQSENASSESTSVNKESSNNDLIISIPQASDNSSGHETQTNTREVVKKEPCEPIENKPEHSNIVNAQNESQYISIIAERHTCNGLANLKIQGYEGDGIWSSNIPVQFSSPQSTHCQVSTDYIGAVLFTYTNANCSDTFTVFFNQPSQNISFEVIPETCGEQNAELIFDIPNGINIQVLGSYELRGNKIVQLHSAIHNIALVDQYRCEYEYEVNVPEKEFVAQISHDALDYAVDYPIYFTSDLDLEGAEYIWDFGDGEKAYDSKPSHKYETPGVYEVKLEIVKGNCSEMASVKNIEIKDRPLAIPNIFTPNNDGQNDVFFISVPEETQTFEAIILTKTGQLVYKWDDPKEGWEGRWQSGQEAEVGSYYYVVRGKDANGKSFEYKSFLELVR